MNVDLYTKSILTAIAACLLWLCWRGGITTVHAQDKFNPSYVIIAGVDGRLPVTIENSTVTLPVGLRGTEENQAGHWSYGDGLPVSVYKALPVGLLGTAYDAQRNKWDFSQPVPVKTVTGP